MFLKLWNWFKTLFEPVSYEGDYDCPLSEDEKRDRETTTVISCGGGDGAV